MKSHFATTPGRYGVRGWGRARTCLRGPRVKRGRDRSAATELVTLLENAPGRVSLQHVLVVGTSVVKHWRQDWSFEDREQVLRRAASAQA